MKLTCIRCPLGCELTVTKKGDEIIVTGNSCIKGVEYGKEEFTAPKRIVTALIKTDNGILPCKTTVSVPKEKVKDVTNAITSLKVKNANIGDTVIKNILDTGADVVVTGTYYK